MNEAEVSFGRRGTVHRGAADAPGILRAEMNARHAERALEDLEAGHTQDVVRDHYDEKGKTLVMGKFFPQNVLFMTNSE